METLARLTDAEMRTIDEAVAIAHQVVWGVMTTVDAKGRPRSRIVHPVWTMEGGRLGGWLTTRRTPVKTRHLAGNRNVGIAYVAANTDFAYFDCTAEWVDDDAGKQECWEAFVSAPEPVRYDPASIWKDGPRSADFAVLRFRPYRVQAARAESIGRGEKAGLVRIEG